MKKWQKFMFSWLKLLRLANHNSHTWEVCWNLVLENNIFPQTSKRKMRRFSIPVAAFCVNKKEILFRRAVSEGESEQILSDSRVYQPYYCDQEMKKWQKFYVFLIKIATLSQPQLSHMRGMLKFGFRKQHLSTNEQAKDAPVFYSGCCILC